MNVSELLIKHGSDKESYHKYGTGCYDLLLLPYRNKAVALLEVGVFYGSSLRAWSDYFLRATEISGVDNDPKETAIDGCSVMINDAYDDNFINTLSLYDIVIDDGPHGLSNQKMFLEKYWNIVDYDGLLIIEDIENDADLKALNAVRQCDWWTHTINIGGAVNSRIAVWVK